MHLSFMYSLAMTLQSKSDSGFFGFLKNTISAQIHFLGCIVALIGLIYLLSLSTRDHQLIGFWPSLIYGVTSVLVFAASAAYHFFSDGFHISPSFNRILKNFDHYSIYLFIAGSYTPVLIYAVQSPAQEILLFSIWSLAIIGIFYTRFKSHLPKWARHRGVYTALFVMMGWVVIFRIQEIISSLSREQFSFLLAGGLVYTFGAAIYATKRPVLFKGIFGFHELWHLCVFIGFSYHYALILSFFQ